MQCDVLIIGANASGSSCAYQTAKNRLKTIFIDKKQEVGLPIKCAEGIGEYLFHLLPFKIPKKLLKWKINGIIFNYENISIKREGNFWRGYAINRDEFDKFLVKRAMKKGAKLMLNSELIDLKFKGEKVKKAIIKTKNGIKEIFPKILVGADGVHSKTADLLGLKKEIKNDYAKVLSFEYENLNLKNPNHDAIYIGDFSDGYAYIFPKSKTNANIGIGVIKDKEKIEERWKEFLQLKEVKCQMKNARIVKEKSGDAPVKHKLTKLNYENVLFVGDAANQNIKPFIEGYLPAIICGNICGEVIVKCLKNRNKLDSEVAVVKFKKTFEKFATKKGKSIRQLSQNDLYHLDEYEVEVNKILGDEFKQSDFFVENLFEEGDKKFNLLKLAVFSKLISFSTLFYLKNESYEKLEKMIIELGKNPPNIEEDF